MPLISGKRANQSKPEFLRSGETSHIHSRYFFKFSFFYCCCSCRSLAEKKQSFDFKELNLNKLFVRNKPWNRRLVTKMQNRFKTFFSTHWVFKYLTKFFKWSKNICCRREILETKWMVAVSTTSVRRLDGNCSQPTWTSLVWLTK